MSIAVKALLYSLVLLFACLPSVVVLAVALCRHWPYDPLVTLGANGASVCWACFWGWLVGRQRTKETGR